MGPHLKRKKETVKITEITFKEEPVGLENRKMYAENSRTDYIFVVNMGYSLLKHKIKKFHSSKKCLPHNGTS